MNKSSVVLHGIGYHQALDNSIVHDRGIIQIVTRYVILERL